MEGKGWIYTLKKGDEDLHASPDILSPVKGKSKGMTMVEGKGKLVSGVLARKPIVKDLLAVSSKVHCLLSSE